MHENEQTHHIVLCDKFLLVQLYCSPHQHPQDHVQLAILCHEYLLYAETVLC